MKITFSFNSKEYQTLDVSGEYLYLFCQCAKRMLQSVSLNPLSRY